MGKKGRAAGGGTTGSTGACGKRVEGGDASGPSSRPRRDGRARWGHAEGGVLTTASRRDGDRVALVGGAKRLCYSAPWGSAFLYWAEDGVVRGLPPRRHRSPPLLPVRGPWRAEGRGAPPRSPSPPRPLELPSCPPPPLARPPHVTPPRPPPPDAPTVAPPAGLVSVPLEAIVGSRLQRCASYTRFDGCPRPISVPHPSGRRFEWPCWPTRRDRVAPLALP